MMCSSAIASKNLFNQSFFLETKSQKFKKTLEFCQKVRNSPANILLAGESGTGKEILAKYIHFNSTRSNENFIAVNCSSYSETLLESELFGYEQGSFTGATSTKKGKFEIADKGTLLLDEVGDISLHTQVKLLRVLETKSVERIGSNTAHPIDFRLISATNADLQDAIFEQKFREDFFYRVSSVVIQVPPLRERSEDLQELIAFFMAKAELENNTKIHTIEKKARLFLEEYDYPGNIRELKNIIDRMVIFSENGIITEDGIPVMHSFFKRGAHCAQEIEQSKVKEVSFDVETQSIMSFTDFKCMSERKYLEWVFEQTGWNVAEAARQLKMSSRQLFNKIKTLAIKRK